MSVRSLAYLHCASCNATTLHTANVCPCGTTNSYHGKALAPRGAFNISSRHYNAQAEAAATKRRCRIARAAISRNRA